MPRMITPKSNTMKRLGWYFLCYGDGRFMLIITHQQIQAETQRSPVIGSQVSRGGC